MARSKYDWPTIDPKVDALLARGLKVVRIAEVLGMRAQTLRDRLSYRRRTPQPGPRRDLSPLVHRSCLNCGAAFSVRSRFLRLCPTCRAEC
ncbi:hypothetical protein AA13595_2860 [Gluconacetobacter johannae DSM 13595]|uniref:Uncharacterized protein n=1 Tax=Gluconacetobacter johannae TaxID=112140 RepID=A0A7W4J9Q4_9PROT|nr:hypothetical protein [Gluconacetobacter johannae]MBB2177279.1 hypothetical protein [Gluconacetobacter johannae]GBQ90316.1 hypothetical protein AA13595_2860 [Gluconacetobacter johannae DSM 13595]